MPIPVFARERFNDTNVDVEQGDRLLITARGEWIDAYIEAGPEGFRRWWLTPVGWTRRYPEARWFELVAVVGKNGGPYFRIGSCGEFTATKSGRAYLFANDTWFKYGNNKGQLEAEVTKLA
jgi:hypothetical protein